MLDPAAVLEERLIGAFARRKSLPAQARSALLHATELLTCASLLALNRLSRHVDPRGYLLARLRKTQFLLAQAENERNLLRSRIERIAARERPHYTPESRFLILCHKERYLLSASETGRRFGVATQTIMRWLYEAKQHPGLETIGSLVKPVPPLRRIGDVARQLVRDMVRHGFGGNLKVAQAVTAACWKLSARSVGRFRREPRVPRPAPPRPKRRARPVVARYPNHGWVLDISEIPTLFRFFSFKLCVVLDLFSRFPLAARLFVKEPSAREIADLVAAAHRRHGRPAFLVSDHGKQFTAGLFARVLERLAVQPRFGAIGSSGSIAIIERLWRTLKTNPSLRSMLPSEAEGRLEWTLLHYAYHRPHQALSGRMPAEVYFNLPRRVSSHAPRGRPGEIGPEPPVAIAFLDPEDQTLPILIPTAA